MGIEDMVNKAKDALGGDEAASAKIDQAADLVKGKAPAQASGAVDAAASAAKGLLGGGGDAGAAPEDAAPEAAPETAEAPAAEAPAEGEQPA